MMSHIERMKRRKAIVADYLGGMLAQEVADKWGMTPKAVKGVVYREGQRLPKEEYDRRVRIQAARRPYAWPDCPAHLADDYLTLSKYYGKHEARRMLDPCADQ